MMNCPLFSEPVIWAGIVAKTLTREYKAISCEEHTLLTGFFDHYYVVKKVI
jgi:hypothetical protein